MSEIEPRYREMLEKDRERWWQSENWDKWAEHYVSEYPRGHFILETLRRYAPELRIEGARVLDVGCGDAGVLIAFAEAGAGCSGWKPPGRNLTPTTRPAPAIVLRSRPVRIPNTPAESGSTATLIVGWFSSSWV